MFSITIAKYAVKTPKMINRVNIFFTVDFSTAVPVTENMIKALVTQTLNPVNITKIETIGKYLE